MYSDLQNIRLLGWDSNCDAEVAALCEEGLALARVIAVDRDFYQVSDGLEEFRAKMAGRLTHTIESTEQRPCVGDWVCVDRTSQDGIGLVKQLISRKTFLRRKSLNNAQAGQMIAANIDVAIIVQSCHYDFNIRRLERYLVMVCDGGTTPTILLTKADLVTEDVLTEQIAQIRKAGIVAPVIPLSNVSQRGVDELQGLLVSGKTYCFIGSSGVGKSTLINTLIGRHQQETKSVSATGEGRHMTVRRELIRLTNGAMVIDNPGMREFGVLGSRDALSGTFADIEALATECRYRDCTHVNEPACAVRAALKSGTINTEHYDSFIKLSREVVFSQLSHVEKRKKDQALGRFIKSAKKSLEDD